MVHFKFKNWFLFFLVSIYHNHVESLDYIHGNVSTNLRKGGKDANHIVAQNKIDAVTKASSISDNNAKMGNMISSIISAVLGEENVGKSIRREAHWDEFPSRSYVFDKKKEKGSEKEYSKGYLREHETSSERRSRQKEKRVTEGQILAESRIVDAEEQLKYIWSLEGNAGSNASQGVSSRRNDSRDLRFTHGNGENKWQSFRPSKGKYTNLFGENLGKFGGQNPGQSFGQNYGQNRERGQNGEWWTWNGPQNFIPGQNPSKPSIPQPVLGGQLESPTKIPTKNPTEEPTTASPTENPTGTPTEPPTEKPTKSPVLKPTPRPTSKPTPIPTLYPTSERPKKSPTDPSVPQPGSFSITLRNMGPPNEKYDRLFRQAKERWEAIVINDLADIERPPNGDWFSGRFGTQNVVAGPIDDVLIGYKVDSIDGKGGTLGEAGPTFVRSDQEGVFWQSAIAGTMIFDKDDFENGQYEDQDIELIVLHEMGHCLGIGTFWVNNCGAACASEGNVDYLCDKANTEFANLDISGKRLMLESEGGRGTACSHWNEHSFDDLFSSELMTGTFEPGKAQPLSRVSAAALEDLGGYKVDYDATDPYPMPLFTSLESNLGRPAMDTEISSKFNVLMATTDFDLSAMDKPMLNSNQIIVIPSS